jgi:hypothetical protein
MSVGVDQSGTEHPRAQIGGLLPDGIDQTPNCGRARNNLHDPALLDVHDPVSYGATLTVKNPLSADQAQSFTCKK